MAGELVSLDVAFDCEKAEDTEEYCPPTLNLIENELADEESVGLAETTDSVFTGPKTNGSGFNPLTPVERSIERVLDSLSDISGFIATAVVDSESGLTLGMLSRDSDFDIELAALAATDIVQAKFRAALAMGLDQDVENVLISRTTQYHLIRPVRESPEVFVYIVLDRDRANLALARMKLTETSAELEI